MFDLGKPFCLGAREWTRNASPAAQKKAAGGIKKAVGKATGDRRLETEGRADKAEGRVRSAIGHAKDAARELVGGKR